MSIYNSYEDFINTPRQLSENKIVTMNNNRAYYNNMPYTNITEGFTFLYEYKPPGIVVTKTNNSVQFANSNISSSPNWGDIGTDSVWTCYSNDYLYGVTARGQIYYRRYDVNNWGSWFNVTSPPGKRIVQLSFDAFSNGVMAIASDNTVWFANHLIYSRPNWRKSPGSLTRVSYSNGQAYGVNANANIFYAGSVQEILAGAWRRVSGALNNVSLDGYTNTVVGTVNGSFTYYCLDARGNTGQWIRSPRNTICYDISLSNGKFAYIGSDNNIYFSNISDGSVTRITHTGDIKQVSYCTFISLNYLPTPPAKIWTIPNQYVIGYHGADRYSVNRTSAVVSKIDGNTVHFTWRGPNATNINIILTFGPDQTITRYEKSGTGGNVVLTGPFNYQLMV